MSFEPELGQAIFSNSGYERFELPNYIESGLQIIGDYISLGKIDQNPTVNSGCEGYENNLFTIEPYCWCDGDREGHKDFCPPNFEWKGTPNHPPFKIRWYKHICRSASIDREVSREEWWFALRSIMNSLVYS